MKNPTPNSLKDFSLEELAVVEAAYRGLKKARRGLLFDLDVFEAVSEHELAKLKLEVVKK